MIQIIKRLYINFVHQILRLYWFIFRPAGNGIKVLLECEGKILFVRHNYGHRLWTIPGGGVKKGEKPEVAAHREIFEELDVELSSVIYLGQYKTDYEYKKVTVDCYKATITKDNKITIDNFEIAEYTWFSFSSLPKEKASSVSKIIAMYEGV